MNHNETQKSIAEWQDATFGPAQSKLRVAVRANEEMAELLRELSLYDGPGHDSRKAVEECADTFIVMCRLGGMLGLNLLQSPSSHTMRNEMVIGSRPIEIATKANVLMGRMMLWLSYDIYRQTVAETASHIAGLLEWIVEKLGGDLRVAVDDKMEINRARKWKLDSSGHGYHVKDMDQ
jgi:hypothetical protein